MLIKKTEWKTKENIFGASEFRSYIMCTQCAD